MGQAIEVGRRTNAKFIILTHFSGRYQKIPPLPEYLAACENVGLAADFMVVRYGHLPLLSKITPIYRIGYKEELDEFHAKSINRYIGQDLPSTAKIPDNVMIHDNRQKKTKYEL